MEGNSTKVIAGLAIAALLAGGVFWMMSSSDEDKETEKKTTSSQQETESDESMEEESSNIVELAQATDSLSTLVSAVVAADLVDTLADESAEFTVFAPTNDAFAALPDGALDDLLLPENKADLAGVLTYHVVASKALSSDLTDGQEITTVNGEKLTVSIVDGVVKINDATVVTADIEASNGVVHVIDGVLLP